MFLKSLSLDRSIVEEEGKEEEESVDVVPYLLGKSVKSIPM